ncbi:Niban-like protein 1 [Bagarius yarrelli]|uniref:Niban-like protein 1 n=1 Tax=Bagarius yarrelli TaxID=175774 RepID=A0A556V5U2_BAGYA|nr:Niban-like protein 1 [Bagarius yarrelli]
MGDLISSHLDEGKREIITERTAEVLGEFGRLYEQQYAVALFNKLRYDVEGGGGPQPQLLHRKVPLENKSIFSGVLLQYIEESKKWRNRFLFVPDSYKISYYESKQAHDRGLHPKGNLNCAGYKVLNSLEKYLEFLDTSLPDVKAKLGSSPFLKCATQYPVILWHPYARHHYFCAATEKEQEKWHAVFQDCIRHSNNGLSDECNVQTPAFTDTVRLYRQAHGQYGTWEMMCGEPSQILANLVMEKLLPELRDQISPRLKGKLQERQKNWMLISDAVYSLVQNQTKSEYEAIVQRCEAKRPPLEASIRTDMDQIITSKEHVTNKIKALVLPKAEKLLKVSIEPYISSILEALMEPTSRGFFEVRDVFFRELVDMSKNLLNGGNKEKLGEYMEKISMLAFHPVKMQCCYEKVEQLRLEGLQQRFDINSPSVFVQRAQILMREQMDDAVYTFEQLLHQSLEGHEDEHLCKTIQRCQDRVIKDLPRFQELIFEDFSRFILVENIFEEVVLQTVMKDIMMAVKEAAVQRKHNLYRDSIVLTNSDPNLHLLGENPSIDWAEEFGEKQEVDGEHQEDGDGDSLAQKRRRMKQVVSMIQMDGTCSTLPNESCLEVPSVQKIPEEQGEGDSDTQSCSVSEKPAPVEKAVSGSSTKETAPDLPNGTAPSHDKKEAAPKASQDSDSKLAIESAIQQIEDAVLGEDGEQSHDGTTLEKTQETISTKEGAKEDQLEMLANQEVPIASTSTEVPAKAHSTTTAEQVEHQDAVETSSDSQTQTRQHGTDTDSGFQSPADETTEGEKLQTATATTEAEEEKRNDSEIGDEDAGKGADTLTAQT